MEQKLYAIIPRQSITYLLICLFGVLVFIFAGLIPSQRSLAKLDRDIKTVTFQIEEHKTLSPIYESLQKRLMAKGSGALPFPARNTLPRDQVSKVPKTFGEIAGKCNMEAVSVAPDLKSLNRGSRFLLFHTVVRGDFLNFRKLLIGLGEVAYVERIEEIQIQQNPDALEFKMKVWVAIS